MAEADDWSPLQADIAMTVANAKLIAFETQCLRAGELVRLGLLKRADAADLLQEAAHYNSLPFEYGQDRVQKLMADGLNGGAD